MVSFISTKTVIKKIALLGLVAIILAGGLYYYEKNRLFLENFRWYYLRTYRDVVIYRAREFRFRFLATVNHLFGPEIYAKPEAEKKETILTLSVPVLVYHGLSPTANRFDITPEGFRDHLFELKKAGYQTITLSQMKGFLTGNLDLPQKSFLLTFDDGRKDSYYPTDPILKDLGFNAVMFISTQASLNDDQDKDSQYYLNREELKKMVESGRWEIGSHAIQEDGGFVTINSYGEKRNFLSNRQWLIQENRLEDEEAYVARVVRELAGSKKQIEDALDIKVTAFSYPFSDFGQQTVNFPPSRQIINEAVSNIYDLAFYQTWPHDRGFSQNHRDEQTSMLKRMEPYPAWNGEFLTSLLENGQSKNIYFEDDFSLNQGWRRSWGEMGLSSGQLEIRSSGQTAGSFALLDGTYDWTDYRLTLSIDWLKGSHFSLIGRFRDESNYYSCTYSDNSVRVEKQIDGQKVLLKEAKNENVLSKNNLTVGASFWQDEIGCLVGGESVVSVVDNDNAYLSGGVAVKGWDKTLGNSLIKIKHFTSEPAIQNENYKPIRLAEML
ncbi:MAG TPA: polysaccharide deacetylase family protein [Candidatus Paceibacterota bacterium]|nr:polysaccharide deacetylase family protein [Candidatus Paceibacterota bacterium]HQJ83753.1 polysaccharide deacetylase family protein [Candidatus Paceibacterota bacterium]